MLPDRQQQKGIIMRKEEFLEKLRARLSQTMSVQEVTAQIHYYDNYIQEQMWKGKSEEEVLTELGDPLLIAKTLMDVQESQEESSRPDTKVYDEQGEQEAEDAQKELHRMEIKTRGGCLLAAIILVMVVAMILWAAGTVLIHLLPILIPVMVILLVVAYFKQR